MSIGDTLFPIILMNFFEKNVEKIVVLKDFSPTLGKDANCMHMQPYNLAFICVNKKHSICFFSDTTEQA